MHRTKSIPHLPSWLMLRAMNRSIAFTLLITTAQSLAMAVNARDNLHARPPLARKSVAARLVSGLVVLRAFLRRLIILIALDMEWALVDKRGAMKRPHGRKSTSSAHLALQGLDAEKPSPWLNGDGPQFHRDDRQMLQAAMYVDMAKLYAQLSYLAGIAANPIAKAKRLAFHLARTRAGIIMAPQGPRRIAGRWGAQVSTSYEAMAASIITISRIRPPPLPPPRKRGPSITLL
jgi:hypothetical protein